ncbi:hypothetical protein ACFVT5_37835 [Streptomyces sp. NPDC058001]|uniref:DUF7224 domain-containing protein n=1 Tax=Streptomyces sp. NPDC058001 TaxID=3346300 RepID=UPI0036EE58D6
MSMPWRIVLRVSIAPRIGVLLLLWLLAYSGNVSELVTDGYWESVTAQTTFQLVWIAPALAACGAWEGLRVRQSEVLRGTPVRSQSRVALSALAPTLALGIVAVALAFALIAPQAAGYPGRPSVGILGLTILVATAHAVGGYALGLSLPRMLAVPVAMLGSWVWMAYPAAMSAFWVRQLNGRNLTECCALDQVAAPRSILAPALVAAGMIAASWLWAAQRRPYRHLAPAVLAAAVTVSALAVHPLGYRAAEPRPAALRSCTGTAPRVCLWPEQRAAAVDITAWATQAVDRLSAAGVRTGRDVSVKSAAPTRNQVLSLVASSAVPNDIPRCAEKGSWPGGFALGPISIWLSLTAGADPGVVSASFAPDEVRIAEQVRRLPQEAQLAWFQRNAQTLTRCDKEPDLDPSHYT